MALDKKILYEEIANQLRANVALVDSDGMIEFSNNQWKDFARHSSHGASVHNNFESFFLDVCLQKGLDSRLAFDGVQEVLSGKRDSYQLEYPCQCNQNKRWFLMQAVSLSPNDEGTLIFHIDITDRKSNEEMRQEICLTHMKFLSQLSHELRNPLNAIMGFTQLIQNKRCQNLTEHQVKHLGNIILAGNHLSALLNNLPDLSSFKLGTAPLSRQKVSLQEIMEESSILVLPLADQKGILLNILYPDSSDQTVNTDFLRLKQVLINLLTNAIKYNHPQGTVNFSCMETFEGELIFIVEDTGPGIPKDQIGNLFKPYFRLNSNPRGIPGSGLGLAITRDLIELLGGRIEVDSDLGKGSRFTVVLSGPMKKTSEARPPLGSD